MSICKNRGYKQSITSCWEQAVYILDHPIKVQKGGAVRVRVECEEGKRLRWSVRVFSLYMLHLRLRWHTL